MKLERSFFNFVKLWQRLMIFKSRSNFKVTRSKIMLLCERTCHKAYTYELESSFFISWKVMAKVFVYTSNAHADSRAMTLAPQTIILTKKDISCDKSFT